MPDRVVPLCVIESVPCDRLALMLHVPERSNAGAGEADGGVVAAGGCVAVDGCVPVGGCVVCPRGMPLAGGLPGLICMDAISALEYAIRDPSAIWNTVITSLNVKNLLAEHRMWFRSRA